MSIINKVKDENILVSDGTDDKKDESAANANAQSGNLGDIFVNGGFKDSTNYGENQRKDDGTVVDSVCASVDRHTQCDKGRQVYTGIPHKFKDVEALSMAYNNLQAEFTRRCQRIKFLENQLNVSPHDGKTADCIACSPSDVLGANAVEYDVDFLEQNGTKSMTASFFDDFVDDAGTKNTSEKDVFAQNLRFGDENAVHTDVQNPSSHTTVHNAYVDNLDDYILHNPRLRAQIIAEYLKEISGKKAVSVIAGTKAEIAVTPHYSPKSLAEAKKIADKMFGI